MKSTHLNGRRSSIIEICDSAAYPSFSFEASCPKERDFRRKNRKEKYRGEDGLYPFVTLIEAPGKVYAQADICITTVKEKLEAARFEAERCRSAVLALNRTPTRLRSIADFRQSPLYAGDGNRIDLAYAVYALAHGVSEQEVRAAIASRNLSHKGNERRQLDYINRTVKKAYERIANVARAR